MNIKKIEDLCMTVIMVATTFCSVISVVAMTYVLLRYFGIGV
jgi:hypothetical protein